MVDRPNTVTYQVYEAILMMNEEEKFTHLDVASIMPPGVNLSNISSALASFAREEGPLIKLIGKKRSIGKAMAYVYVRTGVQSSPRVFRNHRNKNSRKSRRSGTTATRKIPGKTHIEVDVHGGKYMTSIGW